MPPEIERISWPDFDSRFSWNQGEHVTLIGPTGLGKTTLALSILHRRRFVVVVACKPQDPLISDLKKAGYYISREWPVPSHVERVVFWPRIEEIRHIGEQREAIRNLIESVYVQKGWCVYFDEMSYVAKKLGLSSWLEMLWEQGRSLRISVVASTQRPAHVPLAAYSSATHLFFWKDPDETNLKRMGGISGANTRDVRENVVRLPKHDVLYVNTRDDRMVITRAPKR